jgi:hypothetical protein
MLNNFTFKDFKNQLSENKQLRLITYTSAALLGGFILYIAYYQFIWTPSNEKSKDAYWAGLNYASKDSTDLAIQELESAVKKYDGKTGGELAQFVLARQFMTKGLFLKAIEQLEGTDFEGKIEDYYKKEESNDQFYFSAIKKASTILAFWFFNQASEPKEFDELINKMEKGEL